MPRSKTGKLAGMAEAASILGVSNSRVDQLMKSDPKFPEPLDVIAATPVWWQTDIAYYGLTRNTKSGRKAKEK